MGIAIPNFTSIIRNSKLTTIANELVTSLNLARSEAVKRGVQVVVKKKKEVQVKTGIQVGMFLLIQTGMVYLMTLTLY